MGCILLRWARLVNDIHDKLLGHVPKVRRNIRNVCAQGSQDVCGHPSP